MRTFERQLEQRFDRRSLDDEFESLSLQLEQQRGLSGGLRHPLKFREEKVEPQGCAVLRYAKSASLSLFGRATENQRHATMKRHGRLFEKVFSADNLYQAYLDARKGKRNKRACFEFERSLGSNLGALHKEIHGGTYHPQPYYKFEVYEPKHRIIHAPSFRDCVVQHAIYRVIYPIFDRTFIATSFACRKGLGTHKAADYIQHTLRQCDGDSYTLQLDISKFFYSIDRGVLRQQINQKIKDKRLVDVMMLFALHDSQAGIPIGNLLSQIYALIYLNPLDHFVKRKLKTAHYARYVDDFVLIGLSRAKCIEYREKISQFIADELKLKFSKSGIQKVKRGLNFCGYRTWKSRRFIRKHSLYKFKEAAKKSKASSVVSLLGHAKHTSSLSYMISILRESNYGLYCALPESYRRARYASASASL